MAALVELSFAVPRRRVRQNDNDLSNICPDIFSYDSFGDKPDQWTGTLLVENEDDLRGLWIRLVFDKEVDVRVEVS